jgi:hypothetical protein
MGDQVYRLKDGEEIPVEPAGDMAALGWLPGVWVKYSALPLTFSHAFATVELSDGTGVLAGFVITGPPHVQPVILLSDMWTTDQRQRPRGDTHADFGPADAGGSYELDENLQLQRVGTRVVTMVIPPTGFHKFYVFEEEDLAERTVPGSGAALVYTPGNRLYVSNRGRLTSEMESIAHPWTGYVVCRYGSDYEGNYVIAVAAMG